MSSAVRSNLPNAITILRLLFAAAFFAALNAYRYPGEHVIWGNIAIALFGLAATTDFLDGYLARRWHVESAFGRIMDPFCDKILILGAFIYLTGPRFVIAFETYEGETTVRMATGVYPWMVMLILARELLVTSIRGVIESMGFSAASNWSGKAKMILQSIAIPIVLFLVINHLHDSSSDSGAVQGAAVRAWVWYACHAIVYITLAVTVWSGLPYILGLRRVLAAKRSDAKGVL